MKKYPFKHILGFCTPKDLEDLENHINNLKSSSKLQARKFIAKYGIKTLCEIMDTIASWYKSWHWGHSRKLLKHYDALTDIMNLEIPVGAYRGFKISKKEFAQLEWKEGDIISLDVIRNKGCASFTNDLKIANRFSGKSKTHVGIILQLISTTPSGKVVLAPVFKTKPWFNELYLNVMGPAFREKEQEYVICTKKFKAKIVKIKK